jgi:hypothetical protein
MHAFMRRASDRLRMRQGRPGSFVRRYLATAAVFGVGIAVALSGVGGSYALLNRMVTASSGAITSGTIAAGETVTPSLTFIYKNGQTTTTGGVLVSNTGNVPASYSTTVTLGSGSSSPLANAVTVIAWQVPLLSSCTTTATVPSGAYTGTWASIVSGTASPLTGTLAAGGSFGYCLRTTMNVNAAPGIASGSAVTPVFTTALTIGGWINTANASTTQTFIDDIAPAAPTGIASKYVSATSTQLSWTASTDNVGVVAYDVYRNNVRISPAAGVAGASFLDSNVVAGTTYAYAVTARDAVGNVSSSGYVPAPPTVAVAEATPTTTTVSWGAVTDGNGGTTQYDVYRTDALTGLSVKVVAATTLKTYTDAVTALGTYSYTVVARDPAGNTATSAQSSVTMTKVDPTAWYQIVLAASSQPLCVDLNGASTAQGTSLIQWGCKTADDTSRSNQEWQFVAQGTTGNYSVISHLLPSATPAYVWYASKVKKNDATGVVDMESSDGTKAMQWTLTRLSNGNFTVANYGLTQCLSAVSPLNATNSTPLPTTACDATQATQQFTLRQVATP